MRSLYDQSVADRPIDRNAWADLISELIRTEARGRKAAFARLVGVDPKTISHWLDGTVGVSEASVRRVATALNRRAADILIQLGYYSADELAAERPAPAENERQDEELQLILTSGLPMAAKEELIRLLEEERAQDQQRRLDRTRRMIDLYRRRVG